MSKTSPQEFLSVKIENDSAIKLSRFCRCGTLNNNLNKNILWYSQFVLSNERYFSWITFSVV